MHLGPPQQRRLVSRLLRVPRECGTNIITPSRRKRRRKMQLLLLLLLTLRGLLHLILERGLLQSQVDKLLLQQNCRLRRRSKSRQKRRENLRRWIIMISIKLLRNSRFNILLFKNLQSRLNQLRHQLNFSLYFLYLHSIWIVRER